MVVPCYMGGWEMFLPGLIVIRFLVIRMKWRGTDGWAAGRVNALANGTQTQSTAILRI